MVVQEKFSNAEASVPFRHALAVWWRIGFLSFGGPAGQIALMHRIVVEEKRWLDEKRFLHALNYCMLLPGPEAQQLATYTGWLLHGVRGGLAAGILFILPGAFAILALSWLYVLLGDLSVVEGLFFGLKAAVLAIVVQAMIRIAGRTLHGILNPLLAAGGFTALFVFNVPFPVVVLGAGLFGYIAAKAAAPSGGVEADGPGSAPEITVRPGTKRAAAVCLLLWVVTLGLLFGLFGGGHVYTQLGAFFSKMAVVTFGGAYAVLSYVAQQGVEHYGWLQPGEMLDGLGMAETTPGPLILVTQFVGFMAGFREAGTGPALLAATLGAALTTWITFLPCFLWIFGGAPYLEKLRGNRPLSAALAAITAAVVGVIANLALWFAVNALFAEQRTYTGAGMDFRYPLPGSIDPAMLLITVAAAVMVFVFKVRILVLLGSCSALGIVWTVFG